MKKKIKEQSIKGRKTKFILKTLVILCCILSTMLIAKYIKKRYILHQFKTDIIQQFTDYQVLSYKTFVDFETQGNIDYTAFNIDIGLDMKYNEDFNVIFFENINDAVKVVENYISLYDNKIINNSDYVRILIKRGNDAPNFLTISFNNSNGKLMPEKLHLNDVKSSDCVFNLNNIENVNEIIIDLQNTNLKLDFLKQFTKMKTLVIQSDFEDINSISNLKNLENLYLPNSLDKNKYTQLVQSLPDTNIVYNGS